MAHRRLRQAEWCVIFALTILAVLMLDEHIARLERTRGDK
jgi:hypothetical protein